MKKKTTAIALGAILLLTLSGARSSQAIAMETNTDSHSSLKQTDSSQKLVSANTQFGLKLFSAIAKANRGRNVLISPVSVAIGLAIIYNGASGTTKQEMATAMSLGNIDLQSINTANQSLRQSLQNADPKVRLFIANSLWARDGFSFRHQFLKDNRQYYEAQVTTLNFTSPEAAGIINRWVESNTQGKIPQIVDRIEPDDVLYLINAMYFQGTWTEPFDKNQTSEHPFYLANGSSKQHPFMSRIGDYRYYENQQFQAVRLPYGGGRLSMYIFLPKSNSNLDALLEQLNAQNWQQWLSQFKTSNGLVKIPRFNLEYAIEFQNVLAALGMKTMFDSKKAEFANLTSAPVKVNSVKQKIFIEVNEEGTEAATSTRIDVAPTSSAPTFNITVDRPFLCVIRDDQTGTILLIGAIADPQP